MAALCSVLDWQAAEGSMKDLGCHFFLHQFVLWLMAIYDKCPFPYVQTFPHVVLSVYHSLQVEVDHLKRLFDRYIEETLNFKKAHCKELVPITDLNGVMSLCRLYDCLAIPENGVRSLHLRCLLSPSCSPSWSTLKLLPNSNSVCHWYNTPTL